MSCSVVLVLDRDLDAGQPLREHVLGRPGRSPGPVGPAAPGDVDRRQVGVVAPVPRFEQGQDPRPVGTGLRTEHAGLVGTDPGHRVVGPAVGCRRGQPDRPVEQVQHVGEGVAEEARHPQRDVDTGAAELGRPDQLQPLDPTAALGPPRPDAQQRQRFCDVVAAGAHRAGAPDDQPDRGRIAALLGQVPLEDPVGQLHADVPGQPRRHRAGVERVEVATGREHVGHAAGRRAARTG